MTTRWTFHDTVTDEVWEMPINPNAMTSPESQRNLKFGPAGRLFPSRQVTYASPDDATSWQFSGVIRTQAHHDTLVNWASRRVPVEVTDHLGRIYRVVITQLDVTDRQSTRTVPWRLQYQMTTRIVRRIS